MALGMVVSVIESITLVQSIGKIALKFYTDIHGPQRPC